MTLCFICGKVTHLFTYEIRQHTEGRMVCTVVTWKKRLDGWIDGCQPVCTIIPDTMLSKALEKQQSVPQQ